jgi:adenylylsulfate kinase
MNDRKGFGVWLTGIPASGKSSITRDLADRLRKTGSPVVVLESDAIRAILTPRPTYSEDERDRFYEQLVLIGAHIAGSGINVIFDATGNRRAYRDRARRLITDFLEVFVDCPIAVCTARDPKGIYAKAALKKATTVPGVQTTYEPPLSPDVTVDCQLPPRENADRILTEIKQRHYI